MTKVFLHIGMPKCASSTLQAHFWSNYESYCAHGLLYPRSACHKSGFHSHRPVHKGGVDKIVMRVEEIAAEAKAQGCDRILLSSEDFLNTRWDKPESQASVAALNAKFGRDNVRILFVLRDHLSFVESAFAQFVRAGLFRVREKALFRHAQPGITAFADTFRDKNGFEVFDFAQFLSRFPAQENAVEVLALHKADCGGGDIIEKTCRLIGVPSAPLEAIRNPRLSERQLLCLLYARKRYGFEKVKPRRHLLSRGIGRAQRFSSPLFHPDAALRERIAQVAAQDKVFFSSRFAGPFDASFQPIDLDAPAPEGQLRPGARMMQFIDAVMTPEVITMAETLEIRARIFGDHTKTMSSTSASRS